MYVSSMPVDPLKLMLPDAWKGMPFFKQLDVRPAPACSPACRAGPVIASCGL